MLVEDIPIVILPRQSLTREEFVSRFPRGSVALDGVVRGGPFVDDVTLHANFDHHEGVLRDVTMSTAMLCYFAIKCRFCERRDGRFTIVVNDPENEWRTLREYDTKMEWRSIDAVGMPTER